MIKKTRTTSTTASSDKPESIIEINNNTVLLEPVEISRTGSQETAAKVDMVDNDVECIVIDNEEKISRQNDEENLNKEQNSVEQIIREILNEIVDNLLEKNFQTITNIPSNSFLPLQPLPIPIGPGLVNSVGGAGQNMLNGLPMQNIMIQPSMLQNFPQLQQPQGGQSMQTQQQQHMIMLMPQGQINQPFMANSNNSMGSNQPIILNSQQSFMPQQGFLPQQGFMQQQPRFIIGNPSMFGMNNFANGGIIQQQSQFMGNVFPQHSNIINLSGAGSLNGPNIIQTPQGTIIMNSALNQLNLQQFQQQLQQSQMQKTPDAVAPVAKVQAKPIQETKSKEKKDVKTPTTESTSKPGLRRLAKRKSENMTEEPAAKVSF
jgi:hypothetical protein